ncbi:hypothetical protein [Sorangium sp. So ce854]|uniref:hypothetical protein n=1 Tax=Sorangium sp. So ce854 TaxID=3133322 RepID=UPI003F628C79
MVPPFVIDAQGAAVVTAPLQLTPTGDNLVTRVGNPPDDDLKAELFTFVLAAGQTASPSCEQLAQPAPPAGVQAMARTPLVLRKQAP